MINIFAVLDNMLVLYAGVFFFGSFVLAVLIGYWFVPYIKRKNFIQTPGVRKTMYGTVAEEFEKLHGGEDSSTPRFGGLIVCVPALVAIVFLLFFEYSFNELLGLLGVLSVGLAFGVLHDLGEVTKKALSRKVRVGIVAFVGGVVGIVFASVAGGDVAVYLLPFIPPLYMPIAVFVLCMMVWFAGWYAATVIDGIDGLSGSIFLILALTFGVVFLLSGSVLGIFSFALVGSLMGFLLFNRAPARIYLSESGTMPVLLLFAYLSLFVSPLEGEVHLWFFVLAGFVLVVTVGSNVVQVVYRKLFGKKLLRIAPIHHHFEALGVPSQVVVFGYVVVTLCLSLGGVILFVLL